MLGSVLSYDIYMPQGDSREFRQSLFLQVIQKFKKKKYIPFQDFLSHYLGFITGIMVLVISGWNYKLWNYYRIFNILFLKKYRAWLSFGISAVSKLYS